MSVNHHLSFSITSRGERSMKEINALIQIGGGTQAEWNLTTIPIPTGILAYAIDSKIMKLGDGTTLFSDLPTYFDLTSVDLLNEFRNSFPEPTGSMANKLIIVNNAGTGYIVSSIGITDIVLMSELSSLLASKANLVHSHNIGDITGLGTAAVREAGHSPGQVPVIGSNGKLPTSIVPPIVADSLVQEDLLSYLLTAQLAADDGVKLNLPDGIVDEFEDTTGIDADLSTNETYTTGQYAGTDMELVSVAETLDVTPTSARLYFNCVTSGVPNKTLLGAVSRNDGVDWAIVPIEKQRMSVDPVEVYSGTTNFDKTFEISTVDIDTVLIQNTKGSVTSFVVDISNSYGHTNAGLGAEHIGCIMIIEDGTEITITSIKNTGTGTSEVGFVGTLGVGTHVVTSISGIYLDGNTLRTSSISSTNYDLVDIEAEPTSTTEFWGVGTTDTAKYGHSAVAIGTKMYVFGGTDINTTLSTLRIYDSETNTWSIGANDTGRSMHSAVAIGTKMYVFGGHNGSAIISTLRIYDTTNNTWSNGAADTNNERYRHSAVAIGTKMYVFGGVTDITSDTLRIYDSVANSWSAGTSDTGNAKYSHSAVAIGTKMYVFGGSGVTTFDTLRIYDSVANSWSAGTSDTGNYNVYHSAVAIGTKMYVFGGTYQSPKDTLRVYNSETNTWSAGTSDTGNIRYRHSAAAIGTRMYIFGGETGSSDPLATLRIFTLEMVIGLVTKTNGTSVRSLHSFSNVDHIGYVFGGQDGSSAHTNTLYAYDYLTDAWSTLTAGDLQRSAHSAAVFNDKIYIYGGINSGGTLDTLRCYNTTTGAWSSLTSGLSARAYHSAVMVGAKMYVFGGTNGGTLNTHHVYDILANSWTALSDGPNGRSLHTAVAVGSNIYIFGGTNSSSTILDTLIVYDTVSNTWDTLATGLNIRTQHASSAIGDYIYIYGGNNGSTKLSTLHMYNISTDTWEVITDTSTIRYSTAMTAVDGTLYIYGGKDGTNTTKQDLFSILVATSDYSYVYKDGTAILAWDPTETFSIYTPATDATYIYCAVKIGTEYKIFVDRYWKTIVKSQEGTWYYLNNLQTWVASTSELAAVTSAFGHSTNRGFTCSELLDIRASDLSDIESSGLGLYLTRGSVSNIDLSNLVDAVIPEGTSIRYKISSTGGTPLTVSGVRLRW